MGHQVTAVNATYKKVLWSTSWERQTGRSAFGPRQDGGVYIIKTDPNNQFSPVGGFRRAFCKRKWGNAAIQTRALPISAQTKWTLY